MSTQYTTKIALLTSLLCVHVQAFAQAKDGVAVRTEQRIEQLLTTLERNPHRGATFDKVYRHYADEGRIEAIVERHQAATEANDEDIAAWCMLGLLEARQKHRKEADAALAKTAELILAMGEGLPGINNPQPLLEITRYYAEHGNVGKLRQIYAGYLAARAKLSADATDPDYAIYYQRNDLTQVVTNAAQASDVTLSLDFLARLADLPPTSRELPTPSLAVPMHLLAWQLSAQPADKRYEQLREWALPTDKRRSLRFVPACIAGQQVPAAFLPERVKDWGLPSQSGLITNLTLLVAAAKEAKQLDDLAMHLEPLVKAKLPHANCLDVLVALAAEHPAARLKAQRYMHAGTDRIKHPPPADQRRTAAASDTRWDDLQVLAAALTSPNARLRESARAFGEHVLNDNRRTFHLERVTHTGQLLGQAAAADLSANERPALLKPGLKHWTPGTPPGFTTTSMPPAWWTTSGDCLSHITGFEYDSLYFKYPLTGTFEFSFETHSYDFSQAEVAFGGLISIPEYWNGRTQIMPVSRHESILRGAAVEARDWWNHYSVQVSPDEIRFYSNGHLVYAETEPSATSPWFHMVTLDHRRSTIRRPKLTGTPEIPREVQLISDNRLEGWSATQFYEKLANRLVLSEPPPLLPDGRVQPRQIDNRPNDWYAENDVLQGRREGASYQSQSRLFYHRPLLSGETLKYEFFYEPGVVEVHPALGRLAFLLEPEGVEVRWLTNGFSPSDPFALEPDNAIVEPLCRRGPEQLPLTVGDWNAVALSLHDDVVQLTLNDTLIYERTLEPQLERRFGFHYDRALTSAQIRNVVLSGDWPEKLTEDVLGNLLALETPETPALAQARHALVREQELSDDAYHVWRTAIALPANDRYQYLRRWVLPSVNHPTYRLQAEFTPTDPPLPRAREEIDKLRGQRQHVGGELISPAIELVRVAAELKKLDELADDIRASVRQAEEGTRNLLALDVLIAIARGDDNSAIGNLQLLHQQLHGLDPNVGMHNRFPELIAVHAALDRPALRPGAVLIAELLVENQHANGQGLDWERKVRWLRARARWMNDPKTAKIPFGTAPDSKQWIPVSHPTADQRGRGLPAPTWQVEPGKAAFHTGHGNDSLYFQSPLKGNFEVSCLRTTYGWKEIRPMYAALAFDVHYDGLAIWRVPQAKSGTLIPLPTAIEKWSDKVEQRVKVEDGQYSLFINGKREHSESRPEQSDPWLTIQTNAPHFNGSVEDLRIVGAPTIPESILISATSDLSPWRADYYGDGTDAPGAMWTKQGEEIVGSKAPNSPEARRESVLHYHRPLLEDGAIEYEFFYEAGRTEVHPALDRAAFLLSPDGVRVHYLTDAAFDRTGIGPDNEERLADSPATLSLRENNWNHLKLEVVGNLASLVLNGRKIGTYQIEPANQRLFGLFRFSDATGSRIRSVKYRGNWPRKLPRLTEQVLAKP